MIPPDGNYCNEDIEMEDRELLELAAKACGFKIEGYALTGHAFIGSLKLWNPITDDGDAFRLAFFLGIQIKWFGKMEAVRRAIVRAAAEIGRNML
jgi:hypothetical protein